MKQICDTEKKFAKLNALAYFLEILIKKRQIRNNMPNYGTVSSEI